MNQLVLWDHILERWSPLESVERPIVSGQWPNNSNTGYSGNLTTVNSLNVQSDGVYENLRILSVVGLNGKSNVTIRNCLIETSDFFGINADGASNCLVEDTTIVNTSVIANCSILDSGGNVFRRLNLSGAQDGIKLGSGSTLRDSWIHDLAPYDPEYANNDGVQGTGCENVAIIHNRIEMGAGASSAIAFAQGTVGPPLGLLIDTNWLSGGAYTLRLPGDGSENVKVRNNIFGRDFAEAIGRDYVAGPSNEWSNNTFADNGDPINP